jgi:hypothetical protein
MGTPTEPPQSPPPPEQPPPQQPGGGGRRFPAWAIAVIIGVVVLCCLGAGIVAALSLGGGDRDEDGRDGPDRDGPYEQGPGEHDGHAFAVVGSPSPESEHHRLDRDPGFDVGVDGPPAGQYRLQPTQGALG